MSLLDHSFRYGEDDHVRYQSDGFVTFDRFLSAPGLALCQRRIDAMLRKLQPGRDPADIYSAHEQEPWIFELASESKVLDVIEKQIGPNMVLWSSHLICKAPGTGMSVPWHQDAPYWNVTGPLPAGLWIAFDHMDEENGAMAVLPAWHRKGKLPPVASGQDRFSQMIDPDALPSNVEQLAAQYQMPAGGMAIHHTMIPHRSSANTSDRWRRVLVLRYMDAAAEMGDKLYENYQTGEPFPRKGYLLRGADVANRGWNRRA